MAHASIAATDPTRIREDRAIFRALRIIEKRAVEVGELISDPETSGTFFRLRLGNEKNEHFEVAFLDTRHRLIACERLFHGTIDGASVHARVVAQRALELNAAAAICAHNHPSGNPEASGADRAITRTLREALALIDVRLLDHLVVTAGSAVSLARKGWL